MRKPLLPILPQELPNAWKAAIGLLCITGFSIIAVSRWGTRFQLDTGRPVISPLSTRYAVEDISAEVYDASEPGKPYKKPRQIHIDAKRLEALDEAGEQWLLTEPVMTSYETDGKIIHLKGPVARWDNARQEGVFPQTVEASLEQPKQPVAHLHTSQLKWNANKKHISTERSLVVIQGAQSLHAVGLDWALDTGLIELKSHIHMQSTGK